MENFTVLNSLNETTASVLRVAEDYQLYRVARWLDDYSTYILTAAAVVLNSAAFTTICSMKPITSTSIYIAALAVVDTLCLVLKLLTTRLVVVKSIPQEFSCGVLLFLFYYVQYFSSFLIVTISVERFVAVWFPLRVQRVFTRKAVTFSLLGLSVGIIPLSVWAIWIYERHEDETWGIICLVKEEYVPSMKVLRKMHPMIYILIPFVVVLVLNITIIVGLRRSLSAELSSGNGTALRSRIGRRLSVMLVVTSVAFLVLETPMVCLGLFKYFDKKAIEDHVVDFFFVEVAQSLEDINHTVNFILYFFAGEKFRKWFLAMVSQRVCRKPSPENGAASAHMSERMSQRTDSYPMVHHRRIPCEQELFTSRSDKHYNELL